MQVTSTAATPVAYPPNSAPAPAAAGRDSDGDTDGSKAAAPAAPSVPQGSTFSKYA